MSLPVKMCSKCGQAFILRPDKPGLANVCLDCTLPASALVAKARQDAKLHKAKAKMSKKNSNRLQNETINAGITVRRLLQCAPQLKEEDIESAVHQVVSASKKSKPQ